MLANTKSEVTIHGPAEKRGSANSNPLRDAQKRQKTPFRASTLGFSVTSASLHSQKTPRGIIAVNSNNRSADGGRIPQFCGIMYDNMVKSINRDEKVSRYALAMEDKNGKD